MDLLTTKKTLFEANDDFPFKELLLHKPISVLGEPHNFMIKMHLGTKTTPVYIQTPPCFLKEGGFSKVGKQTVADFIISNDNSEFLVWIEKLEDFCHEQLLAKQSDWFETQLAEEDFESLFLPPYKVVKGKGGKLVSVRTSLPITNKVKIFNEAKEEVEFVEPFHTDQSVIGVLEIMGIKCSPRHFHIDFVVRQMMLIKESPLFSQCIISQEQKEKEEEKQSLLESDISLDPSLSLDKPLDPSLSLDQSLDKPLDPSLDKPLDPSLDKPLDQSLELLDPSLPLDLPLVDVSVPEDLFTNEEINLELDIQEFDLELDSSKLVLEKAKKARHLGIMGVLSSRQITFDHGKLSLLL